MRKCVLIFFVLNLLIVNSINSQTRIENSLLWEITGNGLKKPSYLFGTNHVVSYTFILDSIRGFRKAFHSVRQVAVEHTVSPDAIDKTLFMMPLDTTYQMIYTPKEFAFVDSVMKINIQNTRVTNPYKCKPMVWYLASIAKTSAKPDILVIDAYLMQVAKSSNYKLIGLEGKDEIDRAYRKMFSSSSLKDQASLLLEQLKDPQKSIMNSSKIISEYKKQNLNAFEQYLSNFEGVNAKERNQLWMEKIPVIIKQEPTLIAVGAGHLVGEYGLINQLRKQGFTVKPVKQ
ncbi:TraB/GumN family protein [uncultured Bacteroides sp.]|uniref:TraB/GumN family protein n=1 Tax=uncultured Bacteroides sp. TaxID=162156 RepID=UPI002AA7CC62|nr:TraB/GumN family protein [uncultured Bacteroides sp.]